MEPQKPTTTTTICTVVSIDHTDLFYTVCSICERTLPESTTAASPLTRCNRCTLTRPNGAVSSKRLFRVLMSVATDTNVFVVVMFDRAARVLFGCSANDLVNFFNIHPYCGETVSRSLEGEMLRVTLSNPRNGNAQHQRVVSVVPLRSGFRPVMDALTEVYGVRSDR